MKQESFSDMEYRSRKKKTKREEFLEIMDEIIPWEEWVSLVVPHYPTGKRGRPPIEIETMLRMYLLQCWFSLSDEGVEDAIYDSYAMRKFMGINFFEQDVPDATTLLHFRHLLEEKGIGKLFFDAINRCLEGAGRMMRGGSIVDATLISAPSSTKNAEKKREEIKSDPQLSAIEYRINRRPGRFPRVSDNAIDWERYIENRKSAVRCKVEHPYRIVKNIFGFRKTVYRGLRKNLNRLHVLFASVNLYMLARVGGSLCPA